MEGVGSRPCQWLLDTLGSGVAYVLPLMAGEGVLGGASRPSAPRTRGGGGVARLIVSKAVDASPPVPSPPFSSTRSPASGVVAAAGCARRVAPSGGSGALLVLVPPRGVTAVLVASRE
jgi:hypothetical protein